MFQYAYKYEDEYGVYLVRSLDGSLLYSIPDGLFQTIKNEEIKRTKRYIKIDNQNGYVNLDSSLMYAIIDFKKIDYTKEQVDKIVNDINEQYEELGKRK